jgi:patatin-like phospholipase/acyl hydrolase
MAAVTIKSCDTEISARIAAPGIMYLERSGRNIGKTSIDHNIDGGVFSSDGSLLIVFGIPNRVNREYPQVTHLSLYRLQPNPALLMREVYGGGVYDAEFSEGQRFVLVENQFGVDVLDFLKRKSKSFELMYSPPFLTQKCRRN